MTTANILWLILTVVFLVIELHTVSVVSIWFALGALITLAVSYFTSSPWILISVFIVSSAIFLVLLMPFAKKLLKKQKHATNSDRIIGKDAVVTEDIDAISGTGQIKVMGNIWSAKTENGESIAKDTAVTVLNIEGVKAVVKERE